MEAQTTEVVPIQEAQLPAPLPTAAVIQHVASIQDIMRRVMKDGEHYGKIPGCGDKPALLKPGAEKLAMTFRLCPKIYEEVINLPDGHREVRVKVELFSMQGRFLGAGIGCCSTMESKYRFRSESTGKTVPKEYWESRDPELLGGCDFSPKKVGGEWLVVHRVEHDSPADYWNTVVKMAKKRAHVDAVLTVTAASDIFTQDVEEMVEPEAKPRGNGGSGKSSQPNGDSITDKQLGLIKRLEKDLGWDKDVVLRVLQRNHNVDSHRKLTKRQGSEFIKFLQEALDASGSEQSGDLPE